MKNQKETTLKIYSLDMWTDPDGNWYENNRYLLTTQIMKGTVTKRKIMKMLRVSQYTGLYGKAPILMSSSNCVYIEDYHNTGLWYEVGYRKAHEPFLGIMVCEEE